VVCICSNKQICFAVRAKSWADSCQFKESFHSFRFLFRVLFCFRSPVPLLLPVEPNMEILQGSGMYIQRRVSSSPSA
jgi:hypothetical protein